MKRRAATIGVSDHAVLRYLERVHGLDVALVRDHLRGLATNAAELGAVAVKIEGVHLVLRKTRNAPAVGAFVTLTTAIPIKADDRVLLESLRHG